MDKFSIINTRRRVMKNNSKYILSIILMLAFFVQSIGVINATAVENDAYEKMMSIANQEVGYMETTYSDGTFSSKYGEWYGMPNGSWCAMFVSWCANQAGISTESIPKFASCNVGMQWFKNKNLWKEKTQYTPQSGDLIFLNNCTHVGLVEKFEDDIVYTIEGNASDSNGENFGVRKKYYASTSSKILGYGQPDKEIINILNGKATKKEPAYMLPDSSSQTVWEVWKDDDLEILCKDGSYYLVMYPFLSTGKFVCAYVSEKAVSPSSSIPDSKIFYNINKDAITVSSTSLYHNPSDSSLLSNSGEDKKIRATLSQNTNCKILFEKDNYYFIKTDNGITGFSKKDDLKIIKSDSNICGDINNDNTISIADVTILQEYLAQMATVSEIQISVADTNGDNQINISDATEIQKYLAGIINKLPSSPKTEPTVPIETTVPAKDIDVTSIWLPESVEVTLDESIPVFYQILPDNATNKNIYWMSSDESIVTVTDKGMITGKQIGTTKVFAISSNGVRASVTVNVVNKYINVDNISIDKTNPAAVYSGETIQLNATISPSNATDTSIEWTSSNPDIASVDSTGKVTTKSAGTAIITATSSNQEIKATATIKVNQLLSYIANGNYCFRLKGTSSYLDHQGGNANGTNVHLWSGDGNSNANQKIKLERIDDNRYKLWSATSTDLMLDVNRGNSYDNPLKIGLNVDIWQNNDWQAQEWLFTKTYDGYYIIRLNMLQEGAMEASGKDNGSNIFFGTYNCENDMQKWELINTSEYVEPESNGWVYNTQDVGNLNVRSGPGTNYPSIGGFNEGQQITIIGSLNGDWYKVRGANRHDGNIITGYCHKDYISLTPPSEEKKTLNAGTFSNIVSSIGKQTDYRYSESTIMCSAYCVSYVRAYLFNDYRQPTAYWGTGGAQWGASGGTWCTGNVLSIAKDNINAGKPVIIHVNWSEYTHYVVAIGYNNSGNSVSDYTVVDPYYGQIVNMGKYSLYGDNQVITY